MAKVVLNESLSGNHEEHLCKFRLTSKLWDCFFSRERAQNKNTIWPEVKVKCRHTEVFPALRGVGKEALCSLAFSSQHMLCGWVSSPATGFKFITNLKVTEFYTAKQLLKLTWSQIESWI